LAPLRVSAEVVEMQVFHEAHETIELGEKKFP
jgi:hypothetical protein